MTRKLLILTTTVALLLGSLGLPVHLHACRMQAMELSVASGCDMCRPAAATAPPPSCCSGAVDRKESGPVVRSADCCSDTSIHRPLDPVVMPRAGVSLLSLVVLALPTEFVVVEPSITHDCLGNCTDLPPPLLRHSSKSYLFNAAFLI